MTAAAIPHLPSWNARRIDICRTNQYYLERKEIRLQKVPPKMKWKRPGQVIRQLYDWLTCHEKICLAVQVADESSRFHDVLLICRFHLQRVVYFFLLKG
jgi:hypothetical protein